MNKQAAPKEIERKFLVGSLPDLSLLAAAQVRQGYLTGADDSVEIRLRQKGAHDTAKYFITVKSLGGLERSEHEVSTTKEQFDALWPATEGRRVEKTRYVGALSDELAFELDVFTGDLDGLLLVEVEFGSRADADQFAPPNWFGVDVTLDAGYKNKALAVHGAPSSE